jgi:predicted DCC family thiol-disulfide oxidoreductase YuxK
LAAGDCPGKLAEATTPLSGFRAMPVNHPILLFDGVCNLCNRSVQFVLDHEADHAVLFAALQSEAGQSILKSRRVAGDMKSVVLIENGRVYTRSAAVLRLVRHLRWPWRAAAVFVAIPPFLRDWVYDLIATQRYRWFGRTDACRVPTSELRDRFL